MQEYKLQMRNYQRFTAIAYEVEVKGGKMDKIKLDWDLIWEKFDGWYNDSNDPSWENQKKHLESLIEEQLLYQQLEN